MVSRIMVTLEKEERSALSDLARCELRDIRDQVRFLIRQELERQGLLAYKTLPIKAKTLEALNTIDDQEGRAR